MQGVAKNLMIQGTMSNAGKSILTAGILRVLHQDGYRAAPFKSQNMALNSFITTEGLEMGRAQVVQAEAAGVMPEVSMNPILLKPNSDMGSQLIVNGRVRGNYPAREYFKMKKSLIPDIMQAYHTLEEKYDIIVIEGAGSPAEINLKADDIVNMGLARLVDAPVLLAGDIDRGGVFAQLYGTLALLEAEERARIKGLIINKFRGDESILTPGLQMLYEKCHVPFVGVMPYISVDIEEEDSLAERLQHRGRGVLDIAVIRLPKLSNFTDFMALESIEGVSVRYISRAPELGQPDCIILPGSKNTMADLKWLRESGLEALIQKQYTGGTPVMGICGGYQMMGRWIKDPEHVEHGGTMQGIGLLPVGTVFQKEKHTRQVAGHICHLGESREDSGFAALSGCKISGYEIHMGESILLDTEEGFARTEKREIRAAAPILTKKADRSEKRAAVSGYAFTEIEAVSASDKREPRLDGCVYQNGAGTYVHGIFDEPEFCRAFIKMLCGRKGISVSEVKARSYAEYKESQYDILADAVRAHLDMDKIYEIIGIR